MSIRVDSIRQRIRELDVAFGQRTIRERVSLVFGAVAVVFVGIDHFAIQPVEAERKRLAAHIANRSAELPGLEAELALQSQVTMTPEQRRIADETAQIEKQLEQIELRMADGLEKLVPPEEIVPLLEEVLAETPGLRLVQLESRPPEELGVRQGEGEEEKVVGSGLYRHGLRILLEGPYPETVRYLERLEISRWNLLWDRFNYEVQEFPKGRATIDLHTISDHEEWIGV